jgi:hypothetical protein
MKWMGAFWKRITSASVLAGVAVWAASLALYVSTLAPTLTWGYRNIGVDGGELLAAAKTFGIPHPPGYPTYTLLLNLFASAVPVGDFAYRGNLMSAALASASVALLYWALVRFCRFLRPDGPPAFGVVSAALGASVFAASPLFWSQAVITEVYTLNTLFVGALLAIAVHLALPPPSERAPGTRFTSVLMALYGFLVGIGLGNHLTLLAVAAPLLWWIAATLGWRRPAYLWAIPAFALGIGIYAYLPVRAAQDPPINWGDPDTLRGFLWMLSGSAYQDYVFGVAARSIPDRVVEWLRLVFSQFNPLGIFMGLVGAAALRTGEPKFLLASLASIALLSIYSITYNSVDSEVITIPAFMLFSAWISIGFLWLASAVSAWAQETISARNSSTPNRARRTAFYTVTAMSVVAFLALPVASAALNYSSQSLRDDRRAYDYASEVIAAAPDGSVVLSGDEASAFSLWYMRYVEATERDVAPIATPLLQFEWYWRSIHRQFPDRIPAEFSADFTQALKSIVERNVSSSRVFFTYPDQLIQTSYELERVDKLYRVRPRP